jgi:hypothetical protein
MIQRELTLSLTDIYGGDGYERPETVKEVTLEESKTTITVRKDVGVPVEKERERKQVKEKEVSVFTFRRDDDGTPMYRLGGTHGKLWGCMKEAGVLLYQMGEQANKVTTERVMKAVQIQPQWVRLEMPEGVEMAQDTLPQELNGRNSSMVEHHYDVVPECTADVTITHPEPFGEKVEEYLEHAQTINFGNKRRGALEIEHQTVTEV